MDIKGKIFMLAVVITAAFFLFVPATAVILEANGMGAISEINTTEKTITVYSEYQFATSYSGSTPV
ncbi:MAG: hypothetical protein PHV39_06975, partial [Methanomicrobium sp.]|nr:hypothetical protein [Methanomicrobium sp.]